MNTYMSYGSNVSASNPCSRHGLISKSHPFRADYEREIGNVFQTSLFAYFSDSTRNWTWFEKLHISIRLSMGNWKRISNIIFYLFSRIRTHIGVLLSRYSKNNLTETNQSHQPTVWSRNALEYHVVHRIGELCQWIGLDEWVGQYLQCETVSVD